jgi:hypothetical protein
MHAVAPPQPVPILSGFDYVTVDPVRRRVYAAHTVGYDAKSGNAWIVWVEPAGDFVQPFDPSP